MKDIEKYLELIASGEIEYEWSGSECGKDCYKIIHNSEHTTSYYPVWVEKTAGDAGLDYKIAEALVKRKETILKEVGLC